MVSTGVLKFEERAAAGTALTISTLNLNANDNLAGAKDAVNEYVFDVVFLKPVTLLYETLHQLRFLF